MTQPLEPPDTHFASAALGWLGLGCIADAKAELAQISRGQQRHPDVLEVWWLIYAEEKDWEKGLQVSRDLLHRAPERVSGWLHQAYALRRVRAGGLQQAWDALLPVFGKFPREPTVAYNLSCYACQMRRMDAARRWLKLAVAVGDLQHIKEMALADSDLEPLWEEVRQL